MTSSDVWGVEIAEQYDTPGEDAFAEDVLQPTLDCLERLAEGGRVLELAVGTGRLAVPLVKRGIDVTGIELSEAMVAVLRRKLGEDRLPVAIGDMATTVVEGVGDYSLVVLAYNTLSNLLTQGEQVACFANAARHLRSGGRFVIDHWIPQIGRDHGAPLLMSKSADHVGIDSHDVATQLVTCDYYSRQPDGTMRHSSARYRWTWPGECDLMAGLAGLELEHRWGDYSGTPFTGTSRSHVSVWRKPSAPGGVH